MRSKLTAVATAAAGLLAVGVLTISTAGRVWRSEGIAFMVTPALVVGLVALGTIIWHTVDRALRPVQVMRTELQGIANRPGSARVSVPEGHDEVAELARSVNVSLEHMERMAQRQRAFLADASHELRSPLTGLRAELEVALEHPDEQDWPKVAQAALEDTDRLQCIVRDLLIMAKLEAGVVGERERIDLGELVRAETARRSGRVPIEIEAEDAVRVEVNRAHIVRVLTNLLDNADRHARSRVRVAVAADGDQARLMVADDGPGIPTAERERVFHRFQRLTEGRRDDEGGTGLGLPISRDIAQAHGGTLTVGDCPHGARLVLCLPLA